MLLLGLTGVLVPAGIASAHASIESIGPADGTVLAQAPATVVVEFSEPIDDAFIEVSVITATVPIPGDLTGARSPQDPSVLVITLPPLADGSYQLGFSVRDEIDLHEVRGRTSFAIGDHAVVAASPPDVPGPQPWETAARWAFAAGMALLIGGLVLRWRWPDVPVWSPARLGRATVAGVVLVVIGRVGVIVARAADLDTGWADAVRSVARTGDVARLPVVAVAVGCLVPLLRPRRWQWLDAPLRRGRRVSTRVALGGAAVVWLALLAGWADHAALGGTVEPMIAVAKSVHVLGLGAWLGTLAVATIVNAGGGRVGASLRAVRREALTGAVLAVVSGLVLAGRLVVSLTGAFATTFGRLLVLKVALIVIAVVAGLAHRRRAGWAGAETAVLAAVVLAGAAMSTAGPATDAAYLPAPASAAPALRTATADDLIVRARAVPARPGPNDIEVTLASSRRPAAPVESVAVRIMTSAGERTRVLHPDADGAAVVADVDLAEGTTPITFEVVRTGRLVAVVESDVSTEPLAYHHPPIVSSQPIRPMLWWTAVGVALAGAALAVASSRRSPEDGSERRRDVVEELDAGDARREALRPDA